MITKDTPKDKKSKVKELEPVKTDTVQEDIIDIDLSPIQKKKFRLDRDPSRVIELNTSDFNIALRLEKVYPQLLSFADRASEKLEGVDINDTESYPVISQALKDIDQEMRDLINYVFDSDVADKAVPNGSMYDIFNGKFCFEYVIERLANLYETNFNKEFALMQKRMNKHTAKYTGKK